MRSLLTLVLILPLLVGACGTESEKVSPAPERNLGDVASVALGDSAGTAKGIRAEFRLQPPLRLDWISKYWDGGSIGGRLVDAENDTLRFAYSAWMSDPELPERLYLGREHFRRDGAILIEPGAEAEKQLAAALILYGRGDRIAGQLARALIGEKPHWFGPDSLSQ